MLMPKKHKYRKSHTAKRDGVATRDTTVGFGSYGLKAKTACWVTSRQIEAARRVITRYVQRTGKLWIRVFPDRPVTVKGGEIPMGKGKGSVDHYIVPVKPGTILFEIEGIGESEAQEAMRLAAHKLPVKCQFVSRDQIN